MVFSYRRHAASVSWCSPQTADRFIEESAFFDAEARRRYAALGWSRAERAAKVHLTSRLHHGLAGFTCDRPERSGLLPGHVYRDADERPDDQRERHPVT